MGTSSIITSDNEDEMHYLLSLLNSPVCELILKINLKIPSEKEYQVAILPIKNYIRVPIINKTNIKIKNEIITFTKILLSNEMKTVSDIVDFKKFLIQKFDKIETKKNQLIIYYKNNTDKFTIKENIDLLKKSIDDNKNKIVNEKGLGLTTNLKNLRVVDVNYQKKIKDYLDDLVFALYFNISIGEIGIKYAKKIKENCKKNKFYEIINNNK